METRELSSSSLSDTGFQSHPRLSVYFSSSHVFHLVDS